MVIFNTFVATFARHQSPEQLILDYKTKPNDEIDESRIIEVIKIFKKSYPDLFEDVLSSDSFPEPEGYNFEDIDKPHGHWPQKYRRQIRDK
jgi:hypothetical protein